MIELFVNHATLIINIFLMILSIGGLFGASMHRDRLNQNRTLAIFLAVFFGTSAVVVKGTLGYGLLLVSAITSWWAAKVGNNPPRVTDSAGGLRAASVITILVGATLTSFSFYRLGDYTATTLTWESPVIDELLASLQTNEPLMTSFKNRLPWNHAVLSGSANSLLFGFPALLSLKYLSADLWSLRLPAAISFLGACMAIFLATRRMFGFVVAISAMAVFGLDQVVIIYARYGISAAGSLCALLFSLLFCLRLVQTLKLWLVPCAVVSLYLATLGYAPARIPVLVLTVMTLLGVAVSSGFSAQRKLTVLGAFGLALVPVVFFQIKSQSVGLYLEGRGEQLFGMLNTTYWPDKIQSLQTIASAKKPLTPGEIVGVGIELVRQVTGPQLLSLLDPISPEIRRGASATIKPFHDDPLNLKIIAPTLIPFVLLGISVLVRATCRWASITLLIWFVGCCGAALLSNRVDDHRLVFAIIPLSIWAAIGIDQYVKSWKHLRCPCTIIVGGALLFCLITTLARGKHLYDSPGQEIPARSSVREIMREIPSPNVILFADISHQDMAVLRLDLWRDELQSGRRIRSLKLAHKEAIRRGTILYRSKIALEIAELIKNGSVLVLYPANRHKKVAARLAQESLAVFSREIGSSAFLIVSANSEPYSTAVQRAVLPDITAPQRSLPVLPAAQGIPLSSLEPVKSKFGFGRMRLNQTWGGGPFLISGERYQSGVGMHAPTTVRYKVPAGATSFQAIVGIDYDARQCARGSARIILRDQVGKVIHKSGVVTHVSPVSLLVNLTGVTDLEISVTDAGDGRDCDHVDLVDALFVVPGQTAGNGCVCPKPAVAEK